MLSLQLKSGDYFTIGEDIAVQVFQQHGSTFQVKVKAPREIPIARGEVLERDGGQRPEGLRDRRTQQRSRQIHNARQLEVLSKRKDAQTAAVQKLRAALDRAAGLGQPGLEAELSILREQVRLVEETLGLAEPQS